MLQVVLDIASRTVISAIPVCSLCVAESTQNVDKFSYEELRSVTVDYAVSR
jgi:predicted GNAT family acetyltransferase